MAGIGTYPEENAPEADQFLLGGDPSDRSVYRFPLPGLVDYYRSRMGLPVLRAGDAGDLLRVNAAGDALEKVTLTGTGPHVATIVPTAGAAADGTTVTLTSITFIEDNSIVAPATTRTQWQGHGNYFSRYPFQGTTRIYPLPDEQDGWRFEAYEGGVFQDRLDMIDGPVRTGSTEIQPILFLNSATQVEIQYRTQQAGDLSHNWAFIGTGDAIPANIEIRMYRWGKYLVAA